MEAKSTQTFLTLMSVSGVSRSPGAVLSFSESPSDRRIINRTNAVLQTRTVYVFPTQKEAQP